MKQKPDFNISLGARGEMIGWGYLARNGYKILEKNYRCRLGEIDVIAEKNHRIAFIEIKTRSQKRFGLPQEAVGPQKQKKIIQIAQWYLKEKKKTDGRVSFHVLAVEINGKEDPEITLIENAFGVMTEGLN